MASKPACECDGTVFALSASVSGPTVGQALRNRFDAIRESEIERLEKKLRGLSEDERRSVEALTADIIQAIAGIPERALAEGTPQPTLEALVHLFALDT